MSIILDSIQFTQGDFNLSLDLKINDNEFHSIIGPSGSGKTTLLRLLAGFLKPDSGKIIINGKDFSNIQTSKRNIGMVFQDYALFPNMNVFNNIAYGLKIRKMNKKRINEKVSELLELINLPGYENRKIYELSGGEKQRIALARAIAPEPEFLLFDEPLSALDVKLRQELRREIKSIQKKVGFTAIYVTHDQQEAMVMSDKISVISNGRIMQTGTAEDLYNNPENIFTANFTGTTNCINGIHFRPEFCKITDNPDNSFKVIVENSEYLGGRYICSGKVSNNNDISFYSTEKLLKGNIVFIKITLKLSF